MKPLHQILPFKHFFIGAMGLVLASCGSYEYAGYEDDGIYSSENPEVYANQDNTETYGEAMYYEQLFEQQAQQVGEIIPQEDIIFTDVESYTSTGAYDANGYVAQQSINYSGGYAGWGDQTSGVSINIYQNPFFGFHQPFLSPFYSPYYRYSNFFRPYWMTYNWGWGYYGYSYHNPYYYNPYGFGNWGYGYHPYRPYWYGNFYNNPYYYYSNRNVAYNTGRRSSYTDYNDNYNQNTTSRSYRLDDTNSSRQVRAVRSRSNRTSDNDRTYTARRTRVDADATKAVRSRERSNRTYRSSNQTKSSREVRRPTRRTRSVPAVRRSSSSRSPAVRSSSSSRRSSGTTRTSRSSRGRGD